jgi:hypothetical protein
MAVLCNTSGPEADWYARGVGGAAARKINKIPVALPNENGQWTGPLVYDQRPEELAGMHTEMVGRPREVSRKPAARPAGNGQWFGLLDNPLPDQLR